MTDFLKKSYVWLVFLLVFVITFCYSMFLTTSISDEIWSYGFCFNVASGLIPYKDFNMVITPLFSIVGSFFIEIFGEYLFSVHIFGALYITVIVILLFKIIGWKSFICYVFLLIYYYPTYNTFLWLFLFLILYLIFCKKDNDIFIGILVGLTFISKQTVGLALFIPYIYYSKNKLKSVILFCIPVMCCFAYLLCNNALFQFIDYCFLGMFDFGTQNSIYTFIVFELLVLFYLIKRLWKSNFNDKECFYILMFQILSFPICDAPHFFYSFVPFLYYFLKNNNDLNIKVIRCIYIYITAFGIFYLIFGLNLEFYLVKDDDNFMYLRNADLELMELENQFSIMEKYEREFDNQFYILDTSYFFKLYRGVNINKFDILNNGNFGYNGEYKYIDEIDDICTNSSCIFFVAHWYYDEIEGQLNKKIFDYVINNYKLIDKYKYFHVYIN